MLKSTYKAVATAGPEEPPLSTGWTEHKAPTGHIYYYNTETKQSTYTRPALLSVAPVFLQTAETLSPSLHAQNQHVHDSRQQSGSEHDRTFRGGLSYQDRSRPYQVQDRPKKKRAIPGCEPWFLVTTKLGRRFVYNLEKNESFWKFPQDVLLATFKMDRQDQDEKQRSKQDKGQDMPSAMPRPVLPAANGSHEATAGADSDSYEEVEVTDDEDEGAADRNDGEGPPKRLRRESAVDTQPPGQVEFNEEDIAYQLAQMGEDYGLDPGEYGDGVGEDEYDTGLPLSLEDAQALFHDLLSDHAINPYSTWDKIVSDGHITDDERYVALSNTRARKEAFTAWSTVQIQQLKEKREKEEKMDPKIAYLAFLHEKATPKLYWLEFKRKYRKGDVMRDVQLSDKDREKMYRDHINRLRLPDSTKKSDLKDLLGSTLPLHLHRNSTLDTLPPALLADLRFISLPSKVRNPLIETYISTLPSLPPQSSDAHASDSEQQAEAQKREKRQKALRDREKMVQAEKRRVLGRMREGREVLREEEMEIEEALRVSGRQGLKGYMEPDEGIVG